MQKRHEPSLRYLRQAVVVDPQDPDSVASLASSLTELGQISEALASIAVALQANPKHADLLSMKAYALTYQTHIDEAQRLLDEVRALKPENSVAISNSLFSSLYSDSLSPQQLSELHQSLSKQVLAAKSPTPDARPPKRSDRRLRIAYLSPDFRSHPVGFFIEPLLRHHNKDHYHVICYALPCTTDEHTQTLQSYGHDWRDLTGLNSAEIAQQIQNDGIDILIDLAGHTAGGRPDLIRCHLAPVQAVFIGYPFSSGIPEMDYLIADTHLVPAQYELLYSERIARLARSFLCYQPHETTPAVAPLPALKNRHITFGSYNNLPKVSQRCLDLWAEVLKAVPDSRMVMMASSLADEGTREFMRENFVRRGIAAERISLLPPVTPLSRFLAEYGRIDIALDTFPYNGGTTTCGALYMGCPVVTLEGETFMGRMGVSLLNTLGHTEWIAQNHQLYVAIASSLASDLTKLSAIRADLREQMLHSGLCDAEGYTQDLERLYLSWMQQDNASEASNTLIELSS